MTRPALIAATAALGLLGAGSNATQLFQTTCAERYCSGDPQFVTKTGKHGEGYEDCMCKCPEGEQCPLYHWPPLGSEWLSVERMTWLLQRGAMR